MLDEFRRAEIQFIHKGATVASPGPDGTLVIAVQPIPIGLSAIAGDVLQDLRSSLDHEVHRIAEATKGKGWPALEGCGFPIRRDSAKYQSERNALIGGLPKQLKGLIDALQPFQQPPDDEARHLELLNELARIDRHRLLHLTVVQVTKFETNIVPLEELAPESLIGDVTPETTHGVKVRMHMRLAFAEAPAQALPVGATLLELAQSAKRVILRMRES